MITNANKLLEKKLKEKGKTQKFGGEKIKRNGKEIPLREWVQENAEGTDLYETLEKTGAIRFHQKNDISEIGEIFQNQDKRTLTENIEHLKKQWTTLDKSIRKEFDNDVNKFINEGNEWAKNKVLEIENKRKLEMEKKKNETEGAK